MYLLLCDTWIIVYIMDYICGNLKDLNLVSMTEDNNYIFVLGKN